MPGIVYDDAEPGLVYARADIGGAYRLDHTTGHWVPLLDWLSWDQWSPSAVCSWLRVVELTAFGSSCEEDCRPDGCGERVTRVGYPRASVARRGFRSTAKVISRPVRASREEQSEAAVPVDRNIYNHIGESWSDGSNPLKVLHGSMTPGRFSCFCDVLTRQRNGRISGLRALHICCRGGFLVKEFARLGCDVMGSIPRQCR